MNYRHAFHAGNFADVLKHAALVRVLLYLRHKDKPFRVIDTHAGGGLYDLTGPEAARSGEARDGVLRLLDGGDLGAAGELLAPYLDLVRAAGAPGLYPGSPLIVQALLRPQDRAIFCELLPEAARDLRRALGRDERVKAVEIDGYTGLKAYVPPVERRGLVLIDPPFERRDEYERAFDSLKAALRKWPGGTYVIWQPVKEPDVAEAFCRAVAAEAPDCLRIDLQVEAPQPGRPLARTGLLIVHPPYVLERELEIILPALARLMARGPGAEFAITRYGRG
ncbi:23S rRNA (adenine(2030)-N(6))-methyltransferase RlmJ [Rhodoblastus sp.]|uniref:23S rRNA (adenine(2030)-N(6))-methyltransferase RlmJ n=1 Tax=Rhodoblastus sp. TaxID=1962975 RepID=UPI0035B4C307